MLTSLSGCAKVDGPTPDGDKSCLEKQEVPVSAHSISANEKATVDQLFTANGIDKRNFRYIRYSRGELKTYYPPYATFDEQVVRVEEYANGIRVFTGQLIFLFRNGAFSSRTGSASEAFSLDATPNATPESIGVVFRAALKEYGDPGPQPCVVVEFGYYNLNAGTGNAPERLVKAWKASRKGSEYPFAYVEDREGKLIYYDNGIRTFR
ncbi:hypothetical protein [Hymenobacter glacialis]|uniref:hypothetical protein n=1 Tax=Hymenobacter glacialis TaxID=1908236 RepID=UPI0019D3B3A5|nr:hypothetical protein [Hymenobacter glacialis]